MSCELIEVEENRIIFLLIFSKNLFKIVKNILQGAILMEDNNDQVELITQTDPTPGQ